METPFEYVFVGPAGEVRELSILEKLDLRTRYGFGDGARPFIKRTYSEKNGWGNLRGYCRRNLIPAHIEIKNPVFNIPPAEIRKKIKTITQMGYEVDFSGIEQESGKL